MMNVLLVAGCLMASLTIVSGQVVFPGFEKEAPPATLHEAHKALQAWLATQAKEDVIEKTVWTPDMLPKRMTLVNDDNLDARNALFGENTQVSGNRPIVYIRYYVVAKGKASDSWKKYLPLEKWAVTEYLVNDEGFRFMVTLPQGESQARLIVDVAHGVDSFQVSGVCWAYR